MAHTQVAAQSKDFGAGSQTDLTGSLVSSVSRLSLSRAIHSLVKIIISIAALTTWQSKRRRVTNHYAAFTDNSSTNINKANTILFFR